MNIYARVSSVVATLWLGFLPQAAAASVAKFPEACDLSGIVTNCSFETGDFTGWIVDDIATPSEPLAVRPAGSRPDPFFFINPAIVTEPSDGDFSATHGFDAGTGTPGTIEIAQDVVLKTTTTALEFDYRAGWDISIGSMDRTFHVDIQPSGGGAPLTSSLILTAPHHTTNLDTGTLTGNVDVTAFAGQAVRIVFRWDIPEFFTGPGFFEIDNVSFVARTLGIYFDPSFTQSILIDPPLNSPITAWVVASRAPLTGWEAAINLPADVSATYSLQPPGSVDSGVGDDNWIVTTPSCVGDANSDLSVLELELTLTDTGLGYITFSPATPSAVAPPAPAWTDCVGAVGAFDAVFSASFEFTDPSIDTIEDIAPDQGHWVQLSMWPSRLDATGGITGYNVWREVTSPKLQARVAHGTPSTRVVGMGAVDVDGRTMVRSIGQAHKASGSLPAGTWEIVTSFFAAQLGQYQVAVPTVVDNVPVDFLVTAHTSDPLTWYCSLVRSGTSIDNLAPGPPSNLAADFAATGVDLHWDPAAEPDVSHWRIYRGPSAGFTPGPANLLDQSTSPDYTDATAPPWDFHYKVSAVDYAQNEGPAASPGSVTAAVLPRVEALALYDAFPNPFNPQTTFMFDLPRRGHVRLLVHDIRGRLIRSLVDEPLAAGRHTQVWNGIDDGRRPVASGVYVISLHATGDTRSRRVVLVK